jgi:hypothetical protein
MGWKIGFGLLTLAVISVNAKDVAGYIIISSM